MCYIALLGMLYCYINMIAKGLWSAVNLRTTGLWGVCLRYVSSPRIRYFTCSSAFLHSFIPTTTHQTANTIWSLFRKWSSPKATWRRTSTSSRLQQLSPRRLRKPTAMSLQPM